MKKAVNKNAAIQDNKKFQGVDKNPAGEKEKAEPVTKNDLKGKTVDRVIADKPKKR
jgi:hypothetical protein